MMLHENQIMDNLVRARKGLPILHLDYSNMTGTVTQTGSGTAGGSQTIASNRSTNIPALTGAIARTFTGVGSLNLAATQVNQLTITAQPLTSSPEVYTNYLAFLKDSDHLRESPCPPSCEEALIFRCYEESCDSCGCSPPLCFFRASGRMRKSVKTYYWVPRIYADEFRKLSLYAVALRGQPVVASQNFEATTLGVVDWKQVDKDDNENYEVFIKIDNKIPNDTGHMIATIGGRLLEDRDLLKVLVNTSPGLKRAQPGTVLEDAQQTNVVRLSVNTKTIGVAKNHKLITKPIRCFKSRK